MKIERVLSKGDIVKVRNWEDMEKEFGVNCWGDIDCPECFVEGMEELCGHVLKIDTADLCDDNSYTYHTKPYLTDSPELDWNWVLTADMLEEVK